MRNVGLTCLLLMLCSLQPVSAAAPEHADIRVLIDISGSMKQNDPQNLRRPAVRMLVGLMQPGTRAGVWTFARWVNNLVPIAAVDPAWKKKVIALSEKINSPGQRTNIEDVLERATRSWQAQDPRYRRHVVLLTDGVVDIDKDQTKNAASRERILDELVPRFERDQVQVHAIALSENADHDLLQQISNATGGQYRKVDDAEQLQRVFLNIFENAGKPNAVPLEDNRFTVDDSIDEATVLVFRREGARDTVLHAPDGRSFTTSDLLGGVAWQSDQGYDMITITEPQAGEWRLEADVDPDNRVMIVTDLKLDTSELPNRLAVGESIPFVAHLDNKGKLIRKAAFLEQVDFSAVSPLPDGVFDYQLNDRGRLGDEEARDGRYSTRLGLDEAHADVEIQVVVENPTFTRERRHRMAVVEPAALAVVDDGGQLLARVEIDDGVMQSGATVALWQVAADDQRIELAARSAPPQVWQAPLADPSLPVHAEFEGQSRAGNLIQRMFGPVYAPGAAPPPPEPEPPAAPVEAAPVPEPEPAAAPVIEPEPAPPTEADVAADEDEGGGWVMPAVALGATNLLLVLGGLAFWWFRRRSAADEPVVLLGEEFDEADAGAAKA